MATTLVVPGCLISSRVMTADTSELQGEMQQHSSQLSRQMLHLGQWYIQMSGLLIEVWASLAIFMKPSITNTILLTLLQERIPNWLKDLGLMEKWNSLGDSEVYLGNTYKATWIITVGGEWEKMKKTYWLRLSETLPKFMDKKWNVHWCTVIFLIIISYGNYL